MGTTYLVEDLQVEHLAQGDLHSFMIDHVPSSGVIVSCEAAEDCLSKQGSWLMEDVLPVRLSVSAAESVSPTASSSSLHAISLASEVMVAA